MKTTAIALSALLIGGATLSAQGRNNNNRVPPGQLPPAGQCRVWYDNDAPGRQPAPMDCRSAESIAARDRSARVIYGSGANRSYGPYASNDPYYGNARNGSYGRAYSRGANNIAFNNGFTDGAQKGRDDVNLRRTYDPSRYGQFRDGNHLYKREYGSEDQYRTEYRQGFVDGYDSAFRGNGGRNR